MKYGTAPSIKEPIGRIYHSRKHVFIWEENCEEILQHKTEVSDNSDKTKDNNNNNNINNTKNKNDNNNIKQTKNNNSNNRKENVQR